ncbi:MAG TPA: EF-P lysine aminoacylase EpmA, partial [Gammaproteobacteria bacterium]|nr:EF-P lysine aminoacylase EpmA [Gammaproteobacteria bacterium]
DWRPAASPEALRARARVLAAIRAFFAERDVMEVETPVLSAAANLDPHIDSLATTYQGPGAPDGRTLYLHTSPEFPMKRLLAAGSGPIYQLGRVFRQGESGRLHNPEFTMLEWYRPGWDHHALMDEVEALAATVLGVTGPAERLSYAEAFQRHLDLNPHAAAVEELIQAALAHGIAPPPGLGRDDRDGWLDLLLSQRIEPYLGRGRPTFIYDYPASQAALARVRGGWPPVAERFELYSEGVELANGFHELADAAEQRRRFEAERARREAETGRPAPSLDERLLAALEAGLPDCAGVALGVDRLLMRAAGAERLEQVLAFPLDRA